VLAVVYELASRDRVAAAVLALTAQIHAAQEVPADLQGAVRLRSQAVAKKDAAVWDLLTTLTSPPFWMMAVYKRKRSG